MISPVNTDKANIGLGCRILTKIVQKKILLKVAGFLQFIKLRFAVLDGEVAVPCNLQPAIAGSNS